METDANNIMDQLLAWCASELGPVEPVSDCSKSHPGAPVLTHRLRLGFGDCFLKTHRHASNWEAEVHGYEQWAAAFGSFAPRLLAVREEEPRALVISALTGKPLESTTLAPAEEHAVWRAAGRAVACLHDFARGEYFGPCKRDGSPGDGAMSDAMDFMAAHLQRNLDRGLQKGYLGTAELNVVKTALKLVPAFKGEVPVPCHRDYCPANWIVGNDGVWAGVIDFEFSEWNFRATDFTRYPDWNWMDRPELMEAFFEGYGGLTPAQDTQRLVAHVRYALTAIVWGEDNHYLGFAGEGRAALKHLGEMLV